MGGSGGAPRPAWPVLFHGLVGTEDQAANRADERCRVAFCPSLPAASGNRSSGFPLVMKLQIAGMGKLLPPSAERTALLMQNRGEGERRRRDLHVLADRTQRLFSVENGGERDQTGSVLIVPDLNFTAAVASSGSSSNAGSYVEGQTTKENGTTVQSDFSWNGRCFRRGRNGHCHPVQFKDFKVDNCVDGDVADIVESSNNNSCGGGPVQSSCESSVQQRPLRTVDQEVQSTLVVEHSHNPERGNNNVRRGGILDLNENPQSIVDSTHVVPDTLHYIESDGQGSGDAFAAGVLVPHDRSVEGLTGNTNELLDLNAIPNRSGGEVFVGETSSAITGENRVVPWKTRNRTTSGPDHRERIAGRTSALQQALMKFGQRTTDYVIDPAIGTEFDDRQEAYEYYNLYSWEVGFGIRFGKTRYSNDKKNRKLPDNERYMMSQEFNCSCSGRPGKNVKTTSSLTDCPAMLRINRTKDNGWVVVAHNAEHNHELSETYGEKKQWPSHHHLDKYTTDLVRMLRENNVGITKLYSILGNFFGSMENVPTTKRCLKNLCQKINREQAQDDINKTLDLFRELRKADPGFMFSVDPDSEGRIKTLVWTNSRSRMQYQYFGDVITFDTTYKTNLYDMPFGLFVGVNNHFQSVLLGGVLMTDETIESFKWVFKEFASLMGGRPPDTILTDQCRAMEVAIAEEWKETVHRWCKWHVLRRVGECVGVKYTGNRDFRDKFHKMLNEMLTIEEFELAWSKLLEEYGLQSNAFLKQIYETRQMWVKSYFKGVFCARMTSTQRSESANHMLKNIIQPNCPLHQFVQQYMKMQYIRDEEENHQERKSKLNKKCKKTGGPLVMEASKVYTPKVFSLFCDLKEESEFYRTTPLIEGQEYITDHYQRERVERWIKGSYRVSVTEEGSKFSCECGLFEHFGLPCSHILRVLISTGADRIPDSLIMKRWTKKARSDVPGYMAEYTKENPALMALTYRHSSLMIKVLKFVEMGDSNVESHKMAMDIIEAGIDALAEVSKVKDGMGLADRQQQESEDEEENDGLFDNFPQRVPKKRNERGRPTNTRDKPAYEAVSKRPRCCRICRSDQHNKLKCPFWDPALNKPRRPPTCSGCGVAGHTIDRCVADVQQLAVVANLFL